MMTAVSPISLLLFFFSNSTLVCASSIPSLLRSQINMRSLTEWNSIRAMRLIFKYLTHLASRSCYIQSNGEWVHQGVDLDVCNELLIITWFGEADNLWGLRLNLVVECSLSVKAGDLHPAVLSHFHGVQPPQRRHHRSFRDGMGDVGSVSHLKPAQYMSLHRLQEVYVHPLRLIWCSDAAWRARLLGRALSLCPGHRAAAHGEKARN